LAVTKALITANEREISVDSNAGIGTTFSIELPIAEDPTTQLEHESSASDIVPVVRTVGSQVVLYIEDNLANLETRREYSGRRPGITLVSAMQGRLGLEMAKTCRPDLALSGPNLPDISGSDVLRELRRKLITQIYQSL